MRAFVLLSLLLASLLLWLPRPTAVATDASTGEAAPVKRTACQMPVQSARKAISFQEENLPEGKLYTVIIPARSAYEVRPVVSETLETIESFARKNPKAVAVINAGYFDAVNKKTTSYVTIDGKLVADPRQNERLTGNEKLKPYLDKIYNRSQFMVYQCGSQDEAKGRTQMIKRHQYAILEPDKHGYLERDASKDVASCRGTCTLTHAVAAGPLLYSARPLNALFSDMPEATFGKRADDLKVHWAALEEGFIDENKARKLIRDAIGAFKPNARSAVGLTKEGDVILMMGAQAPEEDKTGFTLADMAEQMKRHGAVEALNLDGGGSSGVVYRGKAVYGRYVKGQPEKRAVKSALIIVPVEPVKSSF